jgi:hypothetical protein
MRAFQKNMRTGIEPKLTRVILAHIKIYLDTVQFWKNSTVVGRRNIQFTIQYNRIMRYLDL